MPAVPRLGFSFVDVRDVAALHVAAMHAPLIAGERILAAGTFLWLSQVAEVLREHLGADARKVPHRRAPNPLIRAMSLFDPALRSAIGELGQEATYSDDKAQRLLGFSPRPIEQTIVDTALSLLPSHTTHVRAA